MKKIISIILALVIVLSMTACNKQLIDFNYAFESAIIKLPNGEVIEGKVESWKDYEGEQLQIKIDGKTYLVHSTNVALIHD